MRLDRKYVNAPLSAAKQSMHDLGTQHHSQLVLAVSRFWGVRIKIPGVRLKSTNKTAPHIYPGQELNPGLSGGRRECLLLRHPELRVLKFP